MNLTLEFVRGKMKKHEIAILSFKVLSIYALLQTINGFYSFLYYLFYQKQLDLGEKYNLLMSSVPSLIIGLSAVILWFGSPFLANLVFKKDDVEMKLFSSLEDIQRVAFSVVGLFLIATSLPAVVEIILVLQMASETKGGSGSMIPTIVEILLKGSLGVWLLFGSRGLVNFLMYMNGKREKF